MYASRPSEQEVPGLVMADVHYAVAPAPSVEEQSDTALSGGSLASTSALNLLLSHCSTYVGRVNVNGSYLVGPEGGTRYRAYWALGYYREFHCWFSAIRDRAKVGPSGYGQIRWQGSCAGDTCSRRDIVLVDDWTPVYSVSDYAAEGSRYTNLGRMANCSGFFCTDYSGWIPMT